LDKLKDVQQTAVKLTAELK